MPRGAPVYTREGNAFSRSGNVLIGDCNNQIVDPFGGQHMSDEESLQMFTETIDEVRFILVNEARHPVQPLFGKAFQCCVWSFSLSDLFFSYQRNGSGNANDLRTEGAPRTEPISPADRVSALD